MGWGIWVIVGLGIGLLGFCAYSLINACSARERAYEQSEFEEQNRIMREGVEKWRKRAERGR